MFYSLRFIKLQGNFKRSFGDFRDGMLYDLISFANFPEEQIARAKKWFLSYQRVLTVKIEPTFVEKNTLLAESGDSDVPPVKV